MLDVEELISKLTEDEKCNIVAMSDWWNTVPVHRLGIPSIRFTDGPNGVRGQRHFNGTKTTCFPVATGLSATWNKEILHHVGELLSEECKLKGSRVLLGPTINIQRGPLGGRAFESFSEDPVLSGLLLGQYINGAQLKGIACSLKHFVCNDQEFERLSQDSIVSDRALREIYLMPFQLAIRDSHPLSIMTSYNKLNGVHCSESKELLQGILRSEWGWDGLVMSDWTGTYSTADAIKAGLDLELPGPGIHRRGMLVSLLRSKKVLIHEVDECVRKILTIINDTDKSGVTENEPERTKDYTGDKDFLRKCVAEGVVLLKNETNQLPLSKEKSTAVIGFNAAYTAYAGGGSSLVNPYYKTSPLELIKEKIGQDKVKYELGARSYKFLPTLGAQLKLPEGDGIGARIRVYNYPSTEVVDEILMDDIGYFRMNDYYNDKLNDRTRFYADIESIFVPEVTGEYSFGIAVHGTAKLYIDGKLIIDNATHQERGTAFYGMGSKEEQGSMYCELGKEYKYHIEFRSAAFSELASSGPEIGGGGGLISGGILKFSPDEAIANAKEIAQKCDQCVIVTGLNREWESEGSDRETLALPYNNDELIKAVLEVNPNTVVVIQSGSPVDMTEWIDNCSSLLHFSYGGMETGSGLADVLFGDENPSGKLPLSFPKKLQDNPTFLNFGADKGKVYYGEGVYVGYRYYEKCEREVLFPFGYGLSYTEFKFDNLSVELKDNTLQVGIDVSNVGQIDGKEVVQCYIKPLKPSLKRPIKELKEFSKVMVKASDTERVQISIPLKYATSYWDEEHDSWCSEAGKYEVLIGQSSDGDFTTGQFEVSKSEYWKGI